MGRRPHRKQKRDILSISVGKPKGENVVKQLVIALFTLAALVTSANAHGFNTHTCHKHGAYGYHCHP
jgi:hypothetical protein